MSDVHQLPDQEQVELEASLWIAQLDGDRVTDEDRIQFLAWRNAHPTHARAFDALSRTWRTFTAAGPLVRAVSLGQSLNETTRARGPSRKDWLVSAAAAAVVVAIVGIVLARSPGAAIQ